MTTQAIVERAMLDSIADGVARARFAIEARLGEGSAKWLLIVAAIALSFWALRRR